MSGGNPVLVSVMYSPKARIRKCSFHRVASRPREETSFTRASWTLARGAGEDSVLEHLRFSSASGAGRVWAFVEPGRVGGQVALCHSHLVDSPCHELPQSHKLVWCNRLLGGGGNR